MFGFALLSLIFIHVIIEKGKEEELKITTTDFYLLN